MPSALRTSSLIFSVYVPFWVLLCVLLVVAPQRALMAQSSPTPAVASPESGDAPETAEAQETAAGEEAPDGELESAAVALDLSHSSPLIQKLYEATRETKEPAILDRLTEAKQMLASGADVKATDQYGRTALHWTIFGSSYNTKPKVIVSYEGIADQLIQRGVEINREDVYNDTALDYLLYSPNFEIQTLLIEKGATSGFLTAFFHFYNQENGEMPRSIAASVAKSQQADLAPGQTLSIRLNGPVYSDRSRTGDPVEGTVTYPLCKGGEDIACKEGELVVAPGTRVQATVLFAQKAPDKYSRPRLVLDFSKIVHTDGTRSPLYARVLEVDNARETVRNNEILGIVQPHATTKVSMAMTAVGMTNPIAGVAIRGVSTVYGLSIRREILFPAGTDLQVQVVRPSMLKQREAWAGWPVLPVDARVTTLVEAAPMRTFTKDNKPSDVTNLMFLGSREQVVAAFQEAGWFEADGLSVKSAMKTMQATLRQSGYNAAPVSLLTLEGKPPDMVFQKALDTFAKRHHVRVWKQPGTYEGREVWVGAATHDIAISTEKKGTKWSHRIDPHIDREREWVETDLLFAGTARSYALVERPKVPKKTANATGDEILTDGEISVVELGRTTPNVLKAREPVLQSSR